MIEPKDWITPLLTVVGGGVVSGFVTSYMSAKTTKRREDRAAQRTRLENKYKDTKALYAETIAALDNYSSKKGHVTPELADTLRKIESDITLSANKEVDTQFTETMNTIQAWAKAVRAGEKMPTINLQELYQKQREQIELGKALYPTVGKSQQDLSEAMKRHLEELEHGIDTLNKDKRVM